MIVGDSREMSEWTGYILEDYGFEFGPGMLVLDIGCGCGEQMKELERQGCRVIGLDLSMSDLIRCKDRGLDVLRARAERVPIGDAGVDGIVCKVVLPYTVEDQTIREISRLLRAGGRCYLSCHGAGYYLKYLLLPRSWKQSFYGLRTLVNTWLWVATGRRLPGFLGDTIYQSRRRLAKYYDEAGLRLLRDTPSKKFLGTPVFTYQLLEKGPG
jgi:SAM-dependent methyltransferase